MPVLISMFRAVNVGTRRVKMDALRELYVSLGLQDPQTYVQSGNVIFKTRKTNLNQLGREIEDAFEKAFGFRSELIFRTVHELREVIVRNPFAGRDGIEPSKLLVSFFARDPGEEFRDRIRALKTDPEELRMDGRELFIYFPEGMGRSKLSLGPVTGKAKIPETGRNWNSVTKMLEIAEKLEAGA